MTKASAQAWADGFITNSSTIDAYVNRLKNQGQITPAIQEAIDNARITRQNYDLVFYLAGALTGMSDEIKQRYADVSYLMAGYKQPAMFGYAPHLYGTDPIKHPDVSPQEVHTIDYLWSAIVPDCHINFWTPVSHGNAIEAAWAEQHGIPSLYVVSEGVTLSRLVRGMSNIIGTLVYTDFHRDGLSQIQEFLNEVRKRDT